MEKPTKRVCKRLNWKKCAMVTQSQLCIAVSLRVFKLWETIRDPLWSKLIDECVHDRFIEYMHTNAHFIYSLKKAHTAVLTQELLSQQQWHHHSSEWSSKDSMGYAKHPTTPNRFKLACDWEKDGAGLTPVETNWQREWSWRPWCQSRKKIIVCWGGRASVVVGHWKTHPSKKKKEKKWTVLI